MHPDSGMSDILQTEKDYLRANQAELAEQYPGKYLLLEKEEVSRRCLRLVR